MTAVADDFNRANSTSLGASWTELGGVGDWEIAGNKLQCNTDAGALGYYARYDTDVGSVDMFAQCVTSSTQTSGNSNTGLLVRGHTGATNTSYQMTTRHAGDTLGFWRIVAGAETQLTPQPGGSNLSVPIASGDTLRLEVVGSLLRGKVNGALVGLCRDTNITDGQRAGVNGWNEIASDVVEVDDFAGGALIADGGLLAPFIAGIGDQVVGTATTLTPTIPSVVAAGDLVVVLTTSRDAAQTMAAPAGEGWSSVQTPSQTGLEDVAWAKIWGTGATDDSTPTFTIGSGTAGWGATAVVIRNPAHATTPWTTVTSAVVASGSQSNAASATVTAPSVTDTGTHRTLLRLFSSADDNALLTNNEGALVFGGANYDTTTGNDFAQACSIREDVTTSGSTGTATVTETLVGNDVSNGITLVLASVTPRGVASETDSAPALVFAQKSATLGAAAAETDTARAVAFALKSTVLGAPGSSSESAPALSSATKTTTVGVATETGSAPALAGAAKATAVGVATGAESALALAGQDHGVAVGVASETATGPALAGAEKTATVGQAVEAGVALGLDGAVKATEVGTASETDAALPVDGTLSPAAETEGAPALAGSVKTTDVGVASSAETALALAGAAKLTELGTAVETDSAVGVADAALGTAAETSDAPQLAGAVKTLGVASAGSVEQALPLAGQVKATAVGVASEIGEALPLVIVTITQVRSQGAYNAGSGPLTYDATSGHVYDPDGGLVYDPR